MFFRHSADKMIYPLIVLGALLFISYQPKYRLSAEMPADFFSTANSAGAQKHSLEQKIAWAYWESAQMDIQWKYPRGHPLPTDPPPEFHVTAQALGPVASDSATRQLYWHRLQLVWNLPGTWNKEYEWDWGWASDPTTNAAQWLRDRADRIFTVR